MKRTGHFIGMALERGREVGVADSYIRSACEAYPPTCEADVIMNVVRAMNAQADFVDKISNINTPDRHLADAGWGYSNSGSAIEERVREERDRPGSTGKSMWNVMLKEAFGGPSEKRSADLIARGANEIQRQLYTPKRGVEVSIRKGEVSA